MQNGHGRQISILHFNDVYQIGQREKEPVGGAAKFAGKVQELRDSKPLILFGGDAFNPSLLSTITKGEHMVEILNELGVHVATVGNHDFDFGLANLEKLRKASNFPWLLANLFDKSTGEPLGGAGVTQLLEWQGVKVGIVGLIEKEWIATLAMIEDDTVEYRDFVEEGRRLARELKEEGAELLIALTHMRAHNDRKLAAEAPEFDLVLGGHDHDYLEEVVQPHGTLLVKSGTDFRDLSEVTVQLSTNGTNRPKLSSKRHVITADVSADPRVQELVERYEEYMGEKMGEVIGESLEDLDGRFSTVRAAESNLGNFVCDAWRTATKADVVIMNSGSLRSDAIHSAGELTIKDLVAMLPMLDATCVLELPGRGLLAALENGVGQYPKLEGRFLQVSGVKFAFDPAKPSGERIDPASVEVGGQPLELDRSYRVATKDYMAQGKDGFEALEGAKVLVDAEDAPLLPTLVRNVFTQLEVLNVMGARATVEDLVHKAVKKMARNLHSCCERDFLRHAEEGALTVKSPCTGRFAIAPRLDGRIVVLGTQEEAAKTTQ